MKQSEKKSPIQKDRKKKRRKQKENTGFSLLLIIKLSENEESFETARPARWHRHTYVSVNECEKKKRRKGEK